MIIRSVDTSRLARALNEARTASRIIDARKAEIVDECNAAFTRGSERYAHINTPAARTGFITRTQGEDYTIKRNLSGFDRWNVAATAEGVFVLSEYVKILIEQNNQIIALLKHIVESGE